MSASQTENFVHGAVCLLQAHYINILSVYPKAHYYYIRNSKCSKSFPFSFFVSERKNHVMGNS